MMRNFVREVDTVIDVGGNIGDLTLPLARMVGERGKVSAFESHPESFNVLCANLALNGIRCVKPVNTFVATNENLDTGGEWGKYAYVSERWSTDFVALDALDLPACSLIKVDVDGKELEVLRRGEMLIERHRPAVYFENDAGEASGDLLALAMETLGYNLLLAPGSDLRQEQLLRKPGQSFGRRPRSSR